MERKFEEYIGNSHNSNFVLKNLSNPIFSIARYPNFTKQSKFAVFCFFLKSEYILSTYMKILYSSAGKVQYLSTASGTYPTFSNNHHHAVCTSFPDINRTTDAGSKQKGEVWNDDDGAICSFCRSLPLWHPFFSPWNQVDLIFGKSGQPFFGPLYFKLGPDF